MSATRPGDPNVFESVAGAETIFPVGHIERSERAAGAPPAYHPSHVFRAVPFCASCGAMMIDATGPCPKAVGTITVYDRIPFTASVTPVQAAAWVRARLPEWRESTNGPTGPLHSGVLWTQFESTEHESVLVPMVSEFRDYPRRMVELCDALVALGLASKPSEVLRGMAEIKP